MQWWQTPEPKAASSSLGASVSQRDCWKEEQFFHSSSLGGGLQPAPTRLCTVHPTQSRAGTEFGVQAPHASPWLWRPVALAARRARRGRAQLPAGPSTWGCRWGRGQDSEALSTGVLQANAAAQEGKSTYSAKIVSMQKFCHFRTNFFLRGGKKDFEQIRAEAINTP